MTFGNYDAGKSRPVTVSNPLFNGVRKTDAGKPEFNFGFSKTGNVDGAKAPWEITRTTVSPEQRIAEHTGAVSTAMAVVDKEKDEDFQDNLKFGNMLKEIAPANFESYKENFAVTSGRLEFAANMGNAFFKGNILAS